jgi:peroxiredoxin
MIGERLRENLAKLDLSDEQKAKVKTLLEEVKTKGEELRAQMQNGADDVRDKFRTLMEETRKKLSSILTEEQRTKLMDLMGQDGGPRGPGKEPGRAAPGRAAEQSKTKADAGDSMMMDENSKSSASKRKSEISNAKSQISDFKGPAPGEAAPQLTLKKLDGSTLQLSSLKGRVIVLEFGSYSCPSFRTRAPAMEKLKNDLGSRAQFFIVYGREAHATGEWEVDRNKDEGITVEQPKTFDARKTLAGSAKDKLKITVPMLIDSVDNEAAKALGAGANSAFVIDREGKIAARQDWFEPAALRRAIEEAPNVRPTTRPAP